MFILLFQFFTFYLFFFFFSSRRRHTRLQGDWSSDVCSSDLYSGGDMRLNERSPPRSPILAQRRTSAAASTGSVLGTIASGKTRLGSERFAKSAAQSLYVLSAQARIAASPIRSLIIRQP